MICKANGCDLKRVYKDFCRKHYMQARYHSPTYKEFLVNQVRCIFEGCQKPKHAKGYCSTHYMRLYKRGTLKLTLNFDGKAQERNRARTAKWKKDNWSYYKAYLAATKRHLKNATPQWVDKKQIIEIYKNCPQGHHVDHVVPRLGDAVNGLHVPWNLQYINKIENLKKGKQLLEGGLF